jgi:lysozyme family protein
MDNFARCFAFTLGAEGGYSNNPSDPGNWTGGGVGRGVLRGTKFGISAAAYPQVDIAGLTETDAGQIYRRDYFDPLHGHDLKLPVALVAFDAAVNAGLRRSIIWLQQAANKNEDGMLGPETLVALNAADGAVLAQEALARRMDFYARSPGWTNFGLGWARRMIALAAEILT